MFPHRKISDDDAPADEFVESIKNSPSLAYNRQLEESGTCLRKFILASLFWPDKKVGYMTVEQSNNKKLLKSKGEYIIGLPSVKDASGI